MIYLSPLNTYGGDEHAYFGRLLYASIIQMSAVHCRAHVLAILEPTCTNSTAISHFVSRASCIEVWADGKADTKSMWR